MALYEAFIRFYKEEILDKEGQEIKLIVRDVDDYITRPVIAKINTSSVDGPDQIWVLDPLGRPYTAEPSGIHIIKEEDEEKLLDPEYHKASSIH